ncbi:hypothetical protein BDZ94DRAFT_1316980 [Collybia nuda]|uniref:Arrestin C-terminal-like domain-containing protein n=1 Tax=Collybia nuda TaxID=64659 RepID=A0A9P6CQ50_9AGAR|nr:hypothetical protein BDZ94DRAFT_1316980 [Collybia nuda]
MSPNNAATGLGFDFSLSTDALAEARTSLALDNISNDHRDYTSTQASNRTELLVASGSLEITASEQPYSTSHSAPRMEGLSQATRNPVVRLDASEGASGLREGSCIGLETATLEKNSIQDHRDYVFQNQQVGLSRHGTLLTVGATPERRAAELKSILGSANSRLKPGAVILPNPEQLTHYDGPILLERARSRARVEVDIILHSNTCVQGGYLQGHVTIHIRKRLKNESVVAISGGKVRVIGFESISNERERYPFYQCSSPLSTIATSGSMYREPQHDEEGFSQASEGRHTSSFSMYIPLSSDHGVPKGAMYTQSGVAVRYIAMVSIKIKELESNNRSIAHFYRDCEIWPRLNPSEILAATTQPLQMSASRGLFRGGNGKVNMVASLYRSHWVAGQRCYVNIAVTNGTKKTIKSLTLALLRSTVIFKPDLSLNTLSRDHGVDPDACQTSTSQKQISESVLEMSQRSARGHASTRGWWTGVGPGEHLKFSHFIAIPPDALSIKRSRLLEVDYSLRVSLSTRTLRTTDVQVVLPIRIINFLSVDPPPSLSPQCNNLQANLHKNTSSEGHTAEQPHSDHPPSSNISRPFGSYRTNSRLESLAEAEEESCITSENSEMLDEPLDNAYEGVDSEFYEEYYEDIIDDVRCPNPHEDPDDFSMYEDDADEIVQYTYPPPAIDPENAPRFSDLYYASIQENLDQLSQQDDAPSSESEPTQLPSLGNLQDFNIPIHGTQTYPELRPNARRPIILPRLNRPHGPSTFAQRVQEKINAVAATSDLEILCPRNMHQGPLEPHVIFDPDDNSYFSAQNVLNQTVLEATQDIHDKQRNSTSSIQEMRPSTSRGLHESGPAQFSSKMESTASSAFSAVSSSTANGSRLLPVPPCINNGAFPDTGVDPPESPSTRFPAYAEAHCTDIQDAYQPDHDHVKETQINGEDAVLSTRPSAPRPPMVAPAVGGSASSVKDRIKELEERVRAVELAEA